MSNTKSAALEAVKEWYDSYRDGREEEAKQFVVCAGLAITEIAKSKFPIKTKDFLTKGSQVRTSGSFIKKILAEYGIHKTYNQEGGRTTRSTRPAAEGLVKRLNELEILGNPELRSEVLDELQSFFVEKVKLYFERERLQLDIAIDTISPALIIRHVLQAAMEKNSAGAVAQHLVGAKLALRFREMEVENHSHTTADVQLGRPGDFLLGDTSFHVTVSPGEALFRKCKENIRDGYRTAVIVPDSKVEAAKQLCEIQGLEEQVSLYPLEHFVAQNLEEMSSFERAAFKSGFRELLETYNRRVRDVETDRSLLIEIPKNL